MKKQTYLNPDGSCCILGKKFKSIRSAANEFGYSYDMIYKIVTGKNEPSDLICEMCGYKKEVTKTVKYTRIDK